MTRCEDLRDLLPLHATGDTDVGAALEVDEHVAGCAACAAALADYRGLCDGLRDELGTVPPVPAVPAAAPAGSGLLAWRPLAAAAALLLAGVLLGRWSAAPPPGDAAFPIGVSSGQPAAVTAQGRRPAPLSVFAPEARAWLRQAARPARRGDAGGQDG